MPVWHKFLFAGLASACFASCADTGPEASDVEQDSLLIIPELAAETGSEAPDQSGNRANTAKDGTFWGMVGEQPQSNPASANPAMTKRPVLIGQDGPELDACPSVGKVARLDVSGDNFLAVRGQPTAKSAMIDRLNADQILWMCDGIQDGSWIGVVYDKSGDLACGVGSPVPGIRPYEGPCDKGWVYGKYVELIAG